MSRTEPEGPSGAMYKYVLAGVGLCTPFASVAYWEGVQEGHYSWQLVGLFRMAVLGAVAGAVSGAVAFQLRGLEGRGRGFSYLRWIVAVTCATVVVLVPDMISRRSLDPLLAAIFLGVCGGLGVSAIALYLRDD